MKDGWYITDDTLHDGKVWIEYDGMERGIVQDLISGGIPLEQIVLAFLPNGRVVSAA